MSAIFLHGSLSIFFFADFLDFSPKMILKKYIFKEIFNFVNTALNYEIYANEIML